MSIKKHVSDVSTLASVYTKFQSRIQSCIDEDVAREADWTSELKRLLEAHFNVEVVINKRTASDRVPDLTITITGTDKEFVVECKDPRKTLGQLLNDEPVLQQIRKDSANKLLAGNFLCNGKALIDCRTGEQHALLTASGSELSPDLIATTLAWLGRIFEAAVLAPVTEEVYLLSGSYLSTAMEFFPLYVQGMDPSDDPTFRAKLEAMPPATRTWWTAFLQDHAEDAYEARWNLVYEVTHNLLLGQTYRKDITDSRRVGVSVRGFYLGGRATVYGSYPQTFVRALIDIDFTNWDKIAFLHVSPAMRLMLQAMIPGHPVIRTKPWDRASQRIMLVCEQDGVPTLQGDFLESVSTNPFYIPALGSYTSVPQVMWLQDIVQSEPSDLVVAWSQSFLDGTSTTKALAVLRKQLVKRYSYRSSKVHGKFAVTHFDTRRSGTFYNGQEIPEPCAPKWQLGQYVQTPVPEGYYLVKGGSKTGLQLLNMEPSLTPLSEDTVPVAIRPFITVYGDEPRKGGTRGTYDDLVGVDPAFRNRYGYLGFASEAQVAKSTRHAKKARATLFVGAAPTDGAVQGLTTNLFFRMCRDNPRHLATVAYLYSRWGADHAAVVRADGAPFPYLASEDVPTWAAFGEKLWEALDPLNTNFPPVLISPARKLMEPFLRTPVWKQESPDAADYVRLYADSAKAYHIVDKEAIRNMAAEPYDLVRLLEDLRDCEGFDEHHACTLLARASRVAEIRKQMNTLPKPKLTTCSNSDPSFLGGKNPLHARRIDFDDFNQ